MLQLNRAARENETVFSAVDLHISYRTRVYARLQQSITRPYAIDMHYRNIDRNFFIFISTDVDEEAGGSFMVTVNGQPVDPVKRPVLLDELTVKQLTNFAIVVASEDFRLEFDIDSRIYVRLESFFEDKV